MKEKKRTLNSSNDFLPKTAAIWFWSVVSFFSIVWIILPTLFHSCYRGDVIELQFVAKEWVLATRKHPMLPAWILEIINILTNRAFAAPFIASQICAVIALWSIWSFGRKILSEKFALIAVIASLPYWFFTIESIKYNQNIALIAFWSLSIYLVFQAFQLNKLSSWALAGVSLGLAFHAKYTTILLVFSILCFMTAQQDTRKYWKEKGFYLMFFIVFLIFLPHLIWLYMDDFYLFRYVQNRVKATNLIYHLIYPLRFLVNQFFYLIPVILVLIPCFDWSEKWKRYKNCFKIRRHKNTETNLPIDNQRRQIDEISNVKCFRNIEKYKEKIAERYLFCCIFIPTFIYVAIALCGGIRLTTDYGAICWMFFGIWVLLRFQTKETPNIFLRTMTMLFFVEVVLIVAFFVQALSSPYILETPRKVHFPMRDLGAACDKIWDNYYSTPCTYVGGDWRIAGRAAYAMRNRPSVHFYYWSKTESDNVKPTSTWSTDSDINQKGGMIFWGISENNGSDKYVPDWLHKFFPKAKVIPDPIILPYKTRAKIPPIKIGIAIIEPNK
ncbi:MAG: glycosyltransferase family 39 protein [Planctomycetaceae bacterium]|jgi:4-amino-4-deoxy-L-arabinose transferase-like glycosyltransferase|nr:glycosyltransferase family 39 protein [Planctomycetaceae bacterium]